MTIDKKTVLVQIDNSFSSLPYPLSKMDLYSLSDQSPFCFVEVQNKPKSILPFIRLYSSLSDNPFCKIESFGLAEIHFNRLTKSAQLQYMNKVAFITKAKNFIKCIYNNNLDFKQHPSHGRYVVKPELGASGVAQFVYDVNNDPAIFSVAQYIKKNNTLLTSRVAIDKNNERETVASINDVSTQCRNDSFIFTPYVDNIVKEIRVTTDRKGKPLVTTVREFSDTNIDGYRQATGKSGINEIIKTPEEFADVIIGSVGLSIIKRETAFEIYKLIEDFKLPLTGFDLYITEDGKYSFFEFCSEWGYENFPQNLFVGEARMFMIETARAIYNM